MRIWSLHPKYLDLQGLVALWRETLLAKSVLEGKTKGYKNHPQLKRFINSNQPLEALNQYLVEVYLESTRRGYNFNKEKIDFNLMNCKLTVNTGQLYYEKEHLLKKLLTRDQKKYQELKMINVIEAHPLFEVISGEIEEWEILTSKKEPRENRRGDPGSIPVKQSIWL